MTGNKSLFSTDKAYDGEHVDDLAFNLLSVGQICDNKCKVLFTEDGSEIIKDDKILGYSQNRKANIILNKHTMKFEESLNVTFNESPPTKLSPLVYDDIGEDEAIENNTKVVNNNNIENESLAVDKVVNIKEFKKPKNVNETLGDESWVVAMQEELNQFVANDVWDLVPLPKNQSIIRTKWVYRNKLDKSGIYLYFDAWSLDQLERTLEQIPPYNSILPSLEDIRNGIHRRVIFEKQTKDGIVKKHINQIETNELFDYLKPCELVIRENAYVAIGNRDHVQASIALMLYCLETGRPYNLAYFIVMRMNYFRDRSDKVLPYGMILTRLFKNLKETIEDHPFDECYILVPRKNPKGHLLRSLEM
ncbi:retrovirus-related pol polyprotein from transposon TNT 1-94 [Tanacetum coccineum]